MRQEKGETLRLFSSPSRRRAERRQRGQQYWLGAKQFTP
jgi:hypothetical protein